MHVPKLFICDPNLKSAHGHYLGYASLLATAAEASGVTSVILGSRDLATPAASVSPVLPTFSQTYWEELRARRDASAQTHLVRSARQFGVELRRMLGTDTAPRRRILFFPYANLVEVLGVADALTGLAPVDERVVFLFRRPTDEQFSDARLTRQAYAALLRHAIARIESLEHVEVRLLTDSDALTEDHDELAGRPFQTAPIPVDPRFGAEPFTEPDLPLTIGYFGDARGEKGYLHLPELARELGAELAAGTLRLVIQSNFNVPGGEPGIAEAFTSLRQHPNVVLLMAPPEQQEYVRLMRSVHLIVLPYDADRYRQRTSGILAEAIHAGVPAVVPRGTWLADQLRHNGSGITYAPADAGGFLQAVRASLAQVGDLRARARGRRDAFAAFHNPARLARFVLGERTAALAVAAQDQSAPRRHPAATARIRKPTARSWTLMCDRAVAGASLDTRVPRGTRHDNSANPLFLHRLEQLFPKQELRLLDLGCAGGGFVRLCLDRGHQAVGLDGSDYSKWLGRAEWGEIPEHLFTCDITAPFSLQATTRDGSPEPATFHVVTSWEVLEHIAAADLPRLCRNVAGHLAPGGLWIASIASTPDRPSTACGADWHQSVHPWDWWLGMLQAHGFVNHGHLVNYFGDDWVRGPLQNAPGSFHLVLSRAGQAAPVVPPSTDIDAHVLIDVGTSFLEWGIQEPGLLRYALNVFDRALGTASAPAMVHFLRALTLLRLGRFPEAAAAADACLAIMPQHQGAYAVKTALSTPRDIRQSRASAQAS